ncbi:MAG: OmpA family protein [Bacteroidia bacterium]
MKRAFCAKICIFFLLLSAPAFAQLDRANKYYEKNELSKAIKSYEEVLKKGENAEALEKVANCYMLIRDYENARAKYEKLMALNTAQPLNHLYYGFVLKGLKKYDEAKEEFKKYAEAFPDDKKAPLLIKSCEDVRALSKKAKQFDIATIPGINSEVSEFAPVVLDDKLVFISDRIMPLSSDNYPYLHIYHCGLKNGVLDKDAKAFDYPINTEFHDGHAAFNPEQNLMVITHVDLVGKKDKNFINRSKIYFSKLNGKKWSSTVPFQYNSDSYSVAHASISGDGQRLFFASDMPGGMGGMDIYVCEKEGEGWGQPKNLGEKVNTAGEEVFPFIRKDDVLFFASDGHSGFGGLDIFSALKGNGTYTGIKNLGRDLNSFADDFGIAFLEGNASGYFSSDRLGGAGRDDIYSFTQLNNTITVEGKIVVGPNPNKPFKNEDITLLGDDGKAVATGSTDKDGLFKFDGLEPGKKYMVKLDDVTDTKIKYYMLDEAERFVRETGIAGTGGKFAFRNLPVDPGEKITIVPEGVTLAGNLLVGDNSTKPLANTKVNLVNEKGEIVQTVVTNAFGSFVFTNLPPDNKYLVKVEENDVRLPINSRVILTNKSGKEMQSTNTTGNGSFTFNFLASDKTSLKQMEVADVDLRIDFKGKFVGDNKSPIANTVIKLVNEKGEVIQTTKTDQYGAFRFENLPADMKVLLAVDETDPQLKTLKRITLTDNKGDVVKEIKTSEAVYRFSVLPSEKTKLSAVYVDDPWLKVLKLKNNNIPSKENLTIIEKVYYNYGEYKVLPEAAKILDKVINIMEKDSLLVIEISSHTDSRSSKEYNLKLSEQRAAAAVEYIVKNGITRKRISGKGYGESKPMNKCVDGVECSEEEHAKNRRTEFQIARKGK